MQHDPGVLPSKRVEASRRLSFIAASFPELSARGRSLAGSRANPELPPLLVAAGNYLLRLAQTAADLEAACRLRFRVFNLELGEGLESSCGTGVDQDPWDGSCDHLLVEDRSSGEVVGTYRMQSGRSAARHPGYYSAQEFDFAPYASIRDQVLELGRAAIDREHRSSEVLTLLWRGIAQYARTYRLRYLVGCSSLNSREPGEGWSVYRQLEPFLADVAFQTTPVAGYQLPSEGTERCVKDVKVPRLLRTYIAVGARICGPPAWDRAFGTIDFLTLLDLAQLSPAARQRFRPGDAGSQPPAEPVAVS